MTQMTLLASFVLRIFCLLISHVPLAPGRFDIMLDRGKAVWIAGALGRAGSSTIGKRNKTKIKMALATRT
jgi:hypothetical protein